MVVNGGHSPTTVLLWTKLDNLRYWERELRRNLFISPFLCSLTMLVLILQMLTKPGTFSMRLKRSCRKSYRDVKVQKFKWNKTYNLCIMDYELWTTVYMFMEPLFMLILLIWPPRYSGLNKSSVSHFNIFRTLLMWTLVNVARFLWSAGDWSGWLGWFKFLVRCTTVRPVLYY